MLWSCAGEFAAEDGLSEIQNLDEFQRQFSAPITLSNEVLTEESRKDPMASVTKKYGELITDNYLKAEVGKANAWRTVLMMSLGEKGKELFDGERTDKFRKDSGVEDVYFVNVCTLVPEKVVNVKTLENDTVELSYVIVERNLTPFGKYLKYSEGAEHIHSRKFVKGTFSWALVPIE